MTVICAKVQGLKRSEWLNEDIVLSLLIQEPSFIKKAFSGMRPLDHQNT